MDKIGIKPGARVIVSGVTDRTFTAELRAAGATVARAAAGRNASVIFIQADTPAALRRVGSSVRWLVPDGALWLISPRASSSSPGARPRVTEAGALAAGRAAGLTDIKVIRFSDTHTAHKFVIPRAHRKTH